jgi:DNA invertase Pin-like site-specific DNA recombinase
VTRAVLYLRISESDEASTSLARQREDLLGLADEEGWTVVDVIPDNGLSGGYRRSNAERALAMLRTGEADVLAVWKTDRWSRMGIRAVADLDKVLEARPEARFVAYQDHADSSQPYFKLIFGMLAVAAQAERDWIRGRVRLSIAGLRQNGRYAGGNLPYGYRSGANPDGPGRVLAIDDAEAAVVREAAERVLGGESVYAVSRDLNARGIPTRRGTTWTVRSLRQVLTGDAILGRVRHRGELLRDKNGLPESFWPPVLELMDWTRLRHVLGIDKSPARRGRRERRARLLSGLATCALCGSPLYVRVNGAGHPAYACSARSNGRPCDGVSISATGLGTHVVEWLLDAMGDLELEREIVEPSANDAELADIDRAIKATAAEMLDDDADIEALTARLAALKRRRAELHAAPSEPTITRVSLGLTIRQAWSEWLDPETRQAALRAFFREIDIKIGKGQRGSRTFDPSRVTIRASRPTSRA